MKNKTYSLIIIEDEKRSSNLLYQYIKSEFSSIIISDSVDSVETGINAIRKHKPDIILSDIELPDGNLFDILNETKGLVKTLVIVTAFEQYAVKAIKYSTIDYILKPLSKEDVATALKKCLQRLDWEFGLTDPPEKYIKSEKERYIKNLVENDIIPIRSSNFIEMQKQSNIMYLKADQNYTLIVFKDRSTRYLSRNISYYEEMLNPKMFFRVHLSYIVNLREIVRYVRGRGGSVILKDGTEIDVASRRLAGFMKIFKVIDLDD